MKKVESIIIIMIMLISIDMYSQTVRYRDEIFSSYTMISNITYGTGSKNVLDLYTGTGDTLAQRPLIVYVHGGAFKDGDKDPNSGAGGCGYLKYFGYGMAKRGYVVASINYRLAGWSDDATHYKAMLLAVQDAKAAVRFFRKNAALYNIDTSMIFIAGQSAGAHTAVQLAFLDSTEVLGFSQWGSIGWSGVGGSFENTSLGNAGYSSQVKACFSDWGALVDTNYMQAGGIPVYCVHGTADATVPYMYGTTDSPFNYGSQLIYNRAQNLGIPSGISLYAGLGHSLDSSPSAQADAYVKSANWLYTTMFGGTAAPTLTASPSSLSGMTYYFGNGPSAQASSYTLSASNLSPDSGNVTVTAATDYEVSNTSATTGFTSTTLTVSYTSGGTFSTPTIWVRLKAGLSVGTYNTSEVITNVAGTASANVNCSGSVAAIVPTVIASPTSLTGMTYTIGNGPSATVPTYALSAAYLTPATGNITVTAATDYEISNTSAITGFFDSNNPINIAYTNSGGTITNPTIWVRLKAGLSLGNYNTSEIITNVAGTASANVTCSGSVSGQVSGDYKSIASGNWDALTTWNTFNGSSWVAAVVKPSSTNNVYIEPGTLVTLTGNEACNDIHLASAASPNYGRVVTVTYTLEINGKIRLYTGAIPGANVSSPVNPPFTKTSGSTGVVKIVGNSRVVTNTGEYGASTAAGISTMGSIEIAMSPNQTATFQTAAKFASWKITSGTFDYTGRLSIDQGATTLGDVTVSAGATLVLESSGVVMSRTSTTLGGALNMNGTLILKGTAPTIGMTTANLNGTVIYNSNSIQTLLVAANSGANPGTHTNLILGGTSAKTLGLNTTVNGILSIQGSSTLALSTFTLTYGGSATLEYAGTSGQSTGPEFQATINNLTINNAAGVTMGSACGVNGVFTLANGLLTTTASNLLTLGAAATVSGGSATSFVNGPISITAVVGKTLMAPIGKGSAYRPLWSHIYSLTGSGSLTAEQIETFPTGTVTASGNPILSNTRYFHVTQTGLSGGSIDLTLSWGADDGVLDSTSVTVVGGGTYGGIWTWANNSGAEIGYANTVTTGTFDPGSYALGDCSLGSYSGNPMPVSLSSFTAVSYNGIIKLSWKTAIETDNYGFDVERSSDRLAWSKLGFVNGSGNSNTNRDYSYIDNTISGSGKYYYRLKQIDNNGGIKYSGMTEAEVIKINKYELFQNYPNPFNPSTVISYQIPVAGLVTIKIYNILGTEIATLINEMKQEGIYNINFNACNIASGIYFYRLQAGEYTSIKKFTLIK